MIIMLNIRYNFHSKAAANCQLNYPFSIVEKRILLIIQKSCMQTRCIPIIFIVLSDSQKKIEIMNAQGIPLNEARIGI